MSACVELMCDDTKFYVIYSIFENIFDIHDIALRKNGDYSSNTPDIDIINFDILFIDVIEKYIKDNYNCDKVSIRFIYEPMPDISLNRHKRSFLYQNTKILNTFYKTGYIFDSHMFEGSDYYDIDFQMFLTKNL